MSEKCAVADCNNKVCIVMNWTKMRSCKDHNYIHCDFCGKDTFVKHSYSKLTLDMFSCCDKQKKQYEQKQKQQSQ